MPLPVRLLAHARHDYPYIVYTLLVAIEAPGNLYMQGLPLCVQIRECVQDHNPPANHKILRHACG